MPSVKNPNTISKNRQAARAAKQRKDSKQAAAQSKLGKRGGKVAQADARRGARPGLLPTSGPRAAVSKKRLRKMEKKMGYALRRKMEAEGEVEMRDVPEEKKTEEKKEGREEAAAAAVEMDIE